MTAVPLVPPTPRARHPFLTGNFAPVKRELPMTVCRISHGNVPACLRGGQYVRNGGNALKDDDEQRDAHWFDGDGMLTGVLFHQDGGQPHFINRYILTDVLLSSASTHRRPLLPSITTFGAPVTPFSLLSLIVQIIRTVVLALLTWLPIPGRSSIPLKRISTANTSIWWHDGQAFAGCESGPPMRIMLPGLETAEWWTGKEDRTSTDAERKSASSSGWGSGIGPIKMLREFTTAHPRIDPQTNELLLYHMSFAAPYLRISVIPARHRTGSKQPPLQPLYGAAVPGMEQPKLMHDFCATPKRTILIDMPLSLDPRNLLHGKPMLSYNATGKTRFGVLPRREPGKVRWYESEASCIYHAANAWDDCDGNGAAVTTNLIACRLNSATLVYAAGNVEPPADAHPQNGDVERCQLYYWQFADVPDEKRSNGIKAPKIACEFALSDIPVEFPTMNDSFAQRKNRFVYGTSMRSGTFDAGLGSRSAKIDCLVKFDVQRLVTRGLRARQYGLLRNGEAVDRRSVHDILAASDDGDGTVRVFALPPHHYAQEATFVPRNETASAAEEDDGYLVFFVFDESNGLDDHGDCRSEAQSQLWILDARTMHDVVCKIDLPQRVPYGLHGHFFSQREIDSQRRVDASALRTWAMARGHHDQGLGKGMPAKSVANRGKTLTGALQYAAAGFVGAFRNSVEDALA